MKKAKDIHDLTSLEREIYRLRLEARNMEERFDRNLDHLKENFIPMAVNSLFCRRKKEEDKDGGIGSFLKNEKVSSALSKITDKIVDRAAEGIDKAMDKLFSHNKRGH